MFSVKFAKDERGVVAAQKVGNKFQSPCVMVVLITITSRATTITKQNHFTDDWSILMLDFR